MKVSWKENDQFTAGRLENDNILINYNFNSLFNYILFSTIVEFCRIVKTPTSS